MAVEIVNWIEIPVQNMTRAKAFYENVFQFKTVDLTIGNNICTCLPDTSGEGFCGALVECDTAKEQNFGSLLYLNANGDVDAILTRVKSGGGHIITDKKQTPGAGCFAIFKDTEGNVLAFQEGK